MRILNHKLEGHWHGASPNIGGTMRNPTLLVLHFTASGGSNPSGDANYFMDRSAKASAHVIVGRDASVKQVVPFNRKAWHAGKSIWRGVPNCNDYSIGIEIDNWGKLLKTADGKFRSWTKEVIKPEDVVELTHKHERTPCYWETYDPDQLNALTEVVRTILAKYPSIKEIVGHDDIAPGRKTDPGPALNMSRFRSLVTGRGDKVVVRRRTLANLNERGGPSTSFEVIRTIAKGTVVNIIYDKPGAWAQLDTGGWVNDTYLSQPL